MMRVIVPSLLILASVAAMAAQPRFLGPPVKKPPADAGVAPDAGSADAGVRHGEANPPAPDTGDDAPKIAGVPDDPEDGKAPE